MLVFRNLFRQKTRTLLTLVGVIIGIATVVSLGAIADGMAAGYSTMVSGGQADLVVFQEGSYDLMMSLVDEAIFEQLRAMPEVRSASRMVYSWVQAGEAQYMSLLGYDPDEEAISYFRVVEGQRLTRRGRDALLGRLAARNLKKGVGDTIQVLGGSYKIVGIYETGQAFMDGGLLTTVENAQALTGRPRRISGILLRLRSIDDESAVRERVSRRFTKLAVARTAEFGDQAMMVQSIRAMAWGIALLALIIGGITMTNTIVMSVFERTREIGVLRAVGWGKGHVLRLFLGESLTIALIGGGAGVLLGALLALALSTNPTYGTILAGRVTPSIILQRLLVALVMGLVGGAVPAWRAAQLIPLEALRYEGGGGRPLKNSWLVRRLGPTLRGLLRRRTRTLLTIAGTTIGIAAIVSLQAIVDGSLSEADKIFQDVELVAAQADVSDVSFSNIKETVAQRIASMPGVSFVEGAIFNAVADPKQGFLIVEGYHPASVAIRRFKIIEGQPLSGDREVILGRKAAENLKKSVGETMTILGTTFRVVGLYETGLSWEDGGAVVSLREAQRLFGQPRAVTWLFIKVQEPPRAEEVRAQIEAAFPDLNVSLSSTFIRNSDDMQTSNALMGMIGLLAIFVGGLGMMNTMVMSVMERTREIGLLRAVGWRRRHILWLILRESLALGLLGGLSGLLVGAVLSLGLTLSPIVGGFINPQISFRLVITSLAIALCLGTAGGLYPAWRATRFSPIEALRYE